MKKSIFISFGIGRRRRYHILFKWTF